MPRDTKKAAASQQRSPARLTRSRSMYADNFNGLDGLVDAMATTNNSPKRGKRSGDRKSSDKDNDFDAKRSKPSTSASENDDTHESIDHEDPEVQEIIHQMQVTRNIMGRNYVDVVNRLKLNWVPPCVRDQQFCRSHHHRKCPRPKRIDRLQSYLVKVFSQHNRIIHYLRAVQDMCVRMEFPGEEAVKKILEMVLVSKQPADSPNSTDYILQNCIVVLETVLMKFPPCWPDIKEAYRRIFLDEIDVKLYYPRDAGSERKNIIVFLLNLLAETIDSSSVENKSISTNRDSDSESESEAFSYHDWVAKTSVQYNFTQHSRDEKLDRLFAVLSILTKILEHDFSIWLLRYPSKTSTIMFSENGPLLAKVFFDGNYNIITGSVKKLLEIFVKCIHPRFPQDKIDILSRLISLLSVAMTSCESQQCEQVIYPNIGKITVGFAKEIYKTIFDRFGTKIECFLAAIKDIKVPFMRYLIYDELLLKLDGRTDCEHMNVRRVYELMKRERWKCSTGSRKEEADWTEHKYPNMPKKIVRPKNGEIYRHEYMDLIVDCLKSYCETFRVRRVIREAFAKKVTSSLSNGMLIHRESDDARKSAIKYYLDKMEEEIHELETQLKRKMSFKVKRVDEVPFDNIHVSHSTLISYRDDVKYLGLLLCDVKKLIRIEDGEIFESCYRFLNGILKV